MSIVHEEVAPLDVEGVGGCWRPGWALGSCWAGHSLSPCASGGACWALLPFRGEKIPECATSKRRVARVPAVAVLSVKKLAVVSDDIADGVACAEVVCACVIPQSVITGWAC